MELLNIPNCDILIELIGEEKGLSFDLVKNALENNIHVITANKAMLSKYGNELFKIAERNKYIFKTKKKKFYKKKLIQKLKDKKISDNLKEICKKSNSTNLHTRHLKMRL